MELLEIVFVLAVLLLVFGPKKLPELAQQLGEAFYEFRKASSSMVKAVEAPSVTGNSDHIEDIDKALEEIAGRLNLDTEGKDISQITQQIIDKVEKRNE